MKLSVFYSVLMSAAVFSSIGCKVRAFESADVSSRDPDERSRDKIDPRAYNAYHLWARTGVIDISNQDSDEPQMVRLTQEPVTKFPKKYGVKSGEATVDSIDDVFFVHPHIWRDDGEFTGRPTKLRGQSQWTAERGQHVTEVKEQPEVKGDSIVYPGIPRPLTLKFSKASERAYKHDDAVEYCEKENGRLPTAKEIFDFCAMGLEAGFYGKKNSYAQKSKDARCSKQDLWTLSLNSTDVSAAWRFDSNDGDLDTKSRDSAFLVRCVLFN